MWRRAAGSVTVAAVLASTVLLTSHEADAPVGHPVAPPAAPPVSRLAGRVVVLDAGHQLGNSNFPEQISTPVEAGGFEKYCNTTGTATNDGYPEASFNFDVTRRAAAGLRRLGARVVLTRSTDSAELWGPCVDERGHAGNARGADLKVSIHADGSWDGRGFHVIAPTRLKGWTDDVYVESRALAIDLRDALVAAGRPPATYTGANGLDVRGDLATLNLSDIPVAMVECGNMRDAREAAVMESAEGRQGYADAIVAGVAAFLRT